MSDSLNTCFSDVSLRPSSSLPILSCFLGSRISERGIDWIVLLRSVNQFGFGVYIVPWDNFRVERIISTSFFVEFLNIRG
jgi:hypothetical protein